MRHFFYSLIKYIIALLEFLLGIRLVLKFLGASERAMVVDWLYQATDVIISPFNFIFSNIYIKQGFIDIVAISAMIGYFVLALLILQFINILFNKQQSSQKPVDYKN
ncbi:MAG: hypothetical protein AAB516_02315 [Patescibacteria group bacterium]